MRHAEYRIGFDRQAKAEGYGVCILAVGDLDTVIAPVSAAHFANALLEKETLSREELLELFGEVEPESRASETVGVVRALNAEPGA